MAIATEADALRLLRQRWRLLVGADILVVGTAALLLSLAWPLQHVLGWLLLASTALAWQLVVLWRSLVRNRRVSDPVLLPDLGIANLVTLLRGVPAIIFCGFVAAPMPLEGVLAWAPALLYAAAVLPDFLDGFLARAGGRVTELGAILDMEYDSVLMLAVTLVAVRLGKVPLWIVSVGLARYLFVAGLWLRQRWNLPVYELTPSVTRRLAAGLQMGFFCVALLPPLGPPATTLAGALFAAPILAGFVRDGLIVSGAVSPQSPGYRRYEQWREWIGRWLPLPLRLIAGTTAAFYVLPAFWHAGQGQGPAAGAVPLAGLTALSSLLVVLGIAGRTAACGLLVMACADLLHRPFDLAHALLLITAVPLLHLGGGAVALWRGEDVLFVRRAGERREG